MVALRLLRREWRKDWMGARAMSEDYNYVRGVPDLDDEIKRLRARQAVLVEALVDCQKNVENARIWSGMDWHWNNLAGFYAKRIHDRASAALAQGESEHG